MGLWVTEVLKPWLFSDTGSEGEIGVYNLDPEP